MLSENSYLEKKKEYDRFTKTTKRDQVQGFGTSQESHKVFPALVRTRSRVQ